VVHGIPAPVTWRSGSVIGNVDRLRRNIAIKRTVGMDNATHAIAGLLLAQAVIVGRGRGAPTFARTASVVSAIANNLPDLDFLYARITEGKLGYLLHHRGHTHTVMGGVLATLVLVLALLPLRRRLEPSDFPWLTGLALAGPLVHIAMDSSNNYGVHPFWPADARWFYGDFVFIIEPWYWVFAVPSLVFLSRSRVLRVALAGVLTTGLTLAWWIDDVPWGVATALTLGAIGASVYALRLGQRGRLAFAIAGCLAVTLVFGAASRRALAQVSSAAAEPGPASVLVDAVMTPGTGNPLCFNAIVIDTVATDYRLRLATVAAFPGLFPVERCTVEGWQSSLYMERATSASSKAVRWSSSWAGPRSELARLNRENCQVAALLRFMRAPYWVELDAETLYVGDLRYDRGMDEGFAEMRVAARPRDCPRWVPPWIPPRADVLRTD
jgi:inner membrane protein